MTVGYMGRFFPLKVSGETNWMSSYAAVPLQEGWHRWGMFMVTCFNTDSHPQ